MDENGYKINNLDLTLICEKPKISKYKNKMREKIAKILGIENLPKKELIPSTPSIL